MAILTVINNNDSGVGSLRQAILSAAAGDIINFDPSIVGATITLTTGQLLLNKNLTIDGSNRNITISGNNNSRVFAIPTATTVNLNDFTVVNGNGTGVDVGFPANIGGGIISFGTVNATSLNILNNRGAFGGGIASGTGSTLNLVGSTVDGNISTGSGGGLVASSATLLIDRSTISNNQSPQSPAIQVQRSNSAAITNSTISGNISSFLAGARSEVILNLADTANSNLTISSTTIAFNSIAAGGDASRPPGIYNFSNAGFTASTKLSNSIVANNTGGSGLQLSSGGTGTNVVDGSGGFNLVSDNSVFTLNSATNLFSTNPILAPLGDYGAKNFTLALLPGSPAINSGSTPLTIDERGIPRPTTLGFDRGAFEAILSGPVNTRPTFNGGTLVLGSNNQDLIFGDQLNLGSPDTIAGFAGNDTIDGLAGNDSIDSGFGNDSVVGGFGSDTLLGNIGDDTLTGARPIGSRPVFVGPVQTEFDILIGDILAGSVSGNDLFVLGDAINTFYAVDSGYAVIRDYQAGDRIQRGQATLVVDAPGVNSQIINPLGNSDPFRTLSLGGNLVAVVQGTGIATLTIVAPPL
jgi:RTX calcium-binding nonapeptide repeat (4 copies)